MDSVLLHTDSDTLTSSFIETSHQLDSPSRSTSSSSNGSVYGSACIKFTSDFYWLDGRQIPMVVSADDGGLQIFL
jgi:hypothetical protein